MGEATTDSSTSKPFFTSKYQMKNKGWMNKTEIVKLMHLFFISQMQCLYKPLDFYIKQT